MGKVRKFLIRFDLILAVVLIVLGGVFLFKNSTDKNGKILENNDNNSTKVSTPAEVKKSSYTLSSNSLEDFDLYFLKLENEDVNKVYSPLSIKYTLEMLSEGSVGDTKQQLDEIIGKYVARKYDNSSNMSFANAIFIRNAIKESIKNDYSDKLTTKYNAEVVYDDFNDTTNINNWVSDKTFNLLNNAIDDVSESTFVLVNALAIDMEWENLIQCEYERAVGCMYYVVEYDHENYEDYVEILERDEYDKILFNNSKEVDAPVIAASINKYNIVDVLGEDNIRKTVGDAFDKFVEEDGCANAEDKDKILNEYISSIDNNYGKIDSSTDFYFNDTEDVKVFAKDLQKYDGITLQYVGIMPKNKTLKEYINSISAEGIKKIIKELKDMDLDNFEEGYVTKIRGSIPLFKFDYELKLVDDLKSLGITDVFDTNKTDLSNLTSTKGNYMLDAIHKATIEFSNEGIKAAAVSDGGGAGDAGMCQFEYKYEVPIKEIDLTFNKPYLFLIRDKSTGEVWFTGTVYEPNK